jgi:glutaredoxin
MVEDEDDDVDSRLAKFLTEPKAVHVREFDISSGCSRTISLTFPPFDPFTQASIRLPVAGVPANDSVVVIYHQESDAQVLSMVSSIKAVFNDIGVQLVKDVDLSHDYELQGFINAKKGQEPFPVVFIRDEVIGVRFLIVLRNLIHLVVNTPLTPLLVFWICLRVSMPCRS